MDINNKLKDFMKVRKIRPYFKRDTISGCRIDYTNRNTLDDYIRDMYTVSKLIGVRLILTKHYPTNPTMYWLYMDEFKNRGYIALSHLTKSIYVMKMIYNNVIRVFEYIYPCFYNAGMLQEYDDEEDMEFEE